MTKSILAVLGGWAAVGLLVVLTDVVLGRIYPQEYVQGKVPPDSLSAVSLATSVIYSVIGGWVTAWIAGRKRWAHILALILWGELMGISSAFFTWGKIQNWHQIGLILGWIPAVFLGGYLQIGHKRFREQDPAGAQAGAAPEA